MHETKDKVQEITFGTRPKPIGGIWADNQPTSTEIMAIRILDMIRPTPRTENQS